MKRLVCLIWTLVVLLITAHAQAADGLPVAPYEHRSQEEMAKLVQACTDTNAACTLYVKYNVLIERLTVLGVATSAEVLPEQIRMAQFVRCTDVFGDSPVPFEYVTGEANKGDRTFANGVHARTCRNNEFVVALPAATGIVYVSDWCFNPVFVLQQPPRMEASYPVPSLWCNKDSTTRIGGTRLHPSEVFSNCR